MKTTGSQLIWKRKFEHKLKVIHTDVNSNVIFIFMRNYIYQCIKLTLPFSCIFLKIKMRCSLAAISPVSSLAALSSNQQFNRTTSYTHSDVLIQLIKSSIISFCLPFSETFLFSLLPSFPVLSPYRHFISHHSALSCSSLFLHLYLSIVFISMSFREPQR